MSGFGSKLDSCPSLGRGLPNELILEIASYLTGSHGPNGRIPDVSSLSTLSLVSRKIRNAVIPQLFRSIPITSQSQLSALQGLCPGVLFHCRSIVVVLDEAWLMSLRVEEELGPTCQLLCSSLASILSKTPLLRELRVLAADPCARNAFPLVHAHGISVHDAFQNSLNILPPFTLPYLRSIELDGIEGISPLLRLAPGLESLSVSLTAGFGLSVNRDMVETLKLVPKLKKLAYTPDTLRLESINIDDQDGIVDAFAASRGSADFLVSIGGSLPLLESLDLQTRWYGESTYFCSSSEPIRATELVSALSHFRNLRTLALPSNTASPSDYTLVRSPLITMNNSSYTIIPPSKSLLTARHAALDRTEATELNIAEDLLVNGSSSTLQEFSVVRQIHAEDRLEYAVTYSRAGCTGPSVRVRSASGQDVVVPLYVETVADDASGTPYEDELVSLWEPLRALPWSFDVRGAAPSYGNTVSCDTVMDGIL